MSYYVKVCGKCRTPNHPSMTFCARCGADLPAIKQESETKPADPPAYAVKAEPIAAPRLPATPPEQEQGPLECRIVDIRMPFMSMVTFMVKWALAAIPAIIILATIAALTLAALAGIGVDKQKEQPIYEQLR